MKKKIVSVFLVVALVAIAAMGTLAYFTDSDEVANTFTVGKVGIDLTEPAAGENGKDIGITYDKPIMPGTVFEKDPTITVDADSEDCYLFFDVTLNKFNSLIPVMAQNAEIDITPYMTTGKFSTVGFLADLYQNNMTTFRDIVDDWFTGIKHEDWKIMGYTTTPGSEYLTIRFGFIGSGDGVLSKGEKVTFMTSFQMPETVTSEMLSNEATKVNAFNSDNEPFHLNFKAYAIQKAEIETLVDAYEALFGVTPPQL